MNSIEGRRDPGLHREHIGAQQRRRQVAPNRHQRAEQRRISTHSSIEPSWFPHTPVIL
jgi:hypothetical protein